MFTDQEKGAVLQHCIKIRRTMLTWIWIQRGINKRHPAAETILQWRRALIQTGIVKYRSRCG